MTHISQPPRGRAMLACHCGHVLDRRTMRFAPVPRHGSGPTIPRVVCPACQRDAQRKVWAS